MDKNNKTNIILIHGLFMPGIIMLKLGHFFEKMGYTTTIFSYKTLSKTPQENARNLIDLIESIDDSNVIICHSLGGLLTQQALSHMDQPEQKIQKVISIGTPWQGASILNLMHQYHIDGVVGKSLEILRPKMHNEWQFPSIPLGSIAGHSIIGARSLLQRDPHTPTDGTVTIEETKIKGMTDHTIIPISHTGLIFSNLTAQKILKFIETNHFN
ncbi:DUF7379 domain-containing protein [Wohlfahrtiimonas larvae]|uniref:DUF7379 domain-containing protein n=1 Tax=Wohlfahrtiimonas larvae TaxID=1157986 RepID=A0ABP9MAZ1_9GAMM|nr:hypothetical protein [Wohlfahrtiimonas larvae]